MLFQEVRARDWAHALDLLYADSWNTGLERFRSHFAFRGLSDANYKLQTSLMRLGGPFPSLERHLLRNFRKYARMDDADQYFSDWKWLTIGQHYGLPTRLLDWTYSPFVALHFVTSNIARFDRDGVIWCVDYTTVHSTLPQPFQDELNSSGSDAFTVGMVERAARDLRTFDNLTPDAFAVFFEPPSLDDRIVNQFALFSALSDPTLSFDEWLVRHPATCRRVIIPKAIKWEIRDKLDQANITERVLFPGLGGLADWLTRHYSPK